LSFTITISVTLVYILVYTHSRLLQWLKYIVIYIQSELYTLVTASTEKESYVFGPVCLITGKVTGTHRF